MSHPDKHPPSVDPGLTSSAVKAPGIYLLPSGESRRPQYEQFGKYDVAARGYLANKVRQGSWTLFMDGIFFDRSVVGSNRDAEYAMQLFLNEGADAIQQIDGSFNILIAREGGEEICFLSDLVCSRPWYLYESDSITALAPTPLVFVEASLNMSLNLQALYEMIRLLHTGYDRTLVNEVQRVLPGHMYNIDASGLSEKKVTYKFRQDTDTSLSLDDCAGKVTDMFRKMISGIVTHPKLKNLPVQLPLTGGLDSRHLLAELLAQGRTPDLLRHINIQKKDYIPVQRIADELNIPLLTRNLKQLDTGSLVERWLSRSAGLVNFHQYYLLDLKNDAPGGSHSIGFNGYLMDQIAGISPKTNTLPDDDPYKPVWDRTYTSRTIRKLLFSNEKQRAVETEQFFREETKRYQGDTWFKILMLDLHHRALHYTGIVDGMLSEEVFSFSPAATKTAIEYASRAPYKVAGEKKARLRALKSNFPRLASFPGFEGIPFSEMEVRPVNVKNPIVKNVKLLFQRLIPGSDGNEARESEHEWIRKYSDLHHMHKVAVYESELAEDGFLSSIGLKTCWYINEMGGYQGWTLMSILSAEVAYRLLVKQQPQSHVLDWLTSPGN